MNLRNLSLSLLSSLLPFFAHAENPSAEHFTVGLGWFDAFKDDTALLLDLEYRGAYCWEGLRPVMGASLTTDGGLYGYGGANYDIFLSDEWILTPNFVAGLYSDGGGKNLGHTVEFRSGLELGYQFDDGARAGLAFNHISNASLGDKNPGAETLLFTYSHPISLFGG